MVRNEEEHACEEVSQPEDEVEVAEDGVEPEGEDAGALQAMHEPEEPVDAQLQQSTRHRQV